jgi:hypothetical protein
MAQPGLAPNTQSVTGVGATPPMRVFAQGVGATGGPVLPIPPGILAFVSGSVTYNIEVTGDDVDATGYNPATGNWQPMSSALTALTVSTVATLNAVVTAIRGNATAGSTGKLTMQFTQFVG